jgi:hypothetical protein
MSASRVTSLPLDRFHAIVCVLIVLSLLSLSVRHGDRPVCSQAGRERLEISALGREELARQMDAWSAAPGGGFAIPRAVLHGSSVAVMVDPPVWSRDAAMWIRVTSERGRLVLNRQIGPALVERGVFVDDAAPAPPPEPWSEPLMLIAPDEFGEDGTLRLSVELRTVTERLWTGTLSARVRVVTSLTEAYAPAASAELDSLIIESLRPRLKAEGGGWTVHVGLPLELDGWPHDVGLGAEIRLVATGQTIAAGRFRHSGAPVAVVRLDRVAPPRDELPVGPVELHIAADPVLAVRNLWAARYWSGALAVTVERP